jgi:hypothetical protein
MGCFCCDRCDCGDGTDLRGYSVEFEGKSFTMGTNLIIDELIEDEDDEDFGTGDKWEHFEETLSQQSGARTAFFFRYDQRPTCPGSGGVVVKSASIDCFPLTDTPNGRYSIVFAHTQRNAGPNQNQCNNCGFTRTWLGRIECDENNVPTGEILGIRVLSPTSSPCDLSDPPVPADHEDSLPEISINPPP